jgi:hypothetical protein
LLSASGVQYMRMSERFRYINFLRGKAGEQRGRLSEGSVEVALRARPDIVAVEKAPKWSPRDMRV